MAKQVNPAKATNTQKEGVNVEIDAVPHAVDEIGEIPQTAIQLNAIDQLISTDLKKFEVNVARDWIAKKKVEYMKLTISGVEDKEGKKSVESAWQDVRNKRLAVEKTRKTLKEDILTRGRAIDGEAKELTSLLQPIEDYLKSETDRIEKIKQDEKDRIEREAAEKLQRRVASLLDNGAKFDGSFYGIGDTISVNIVTLKEMKDNLFDDLLGKVSIKNEEILQAEADRLEAERLENERIENQRIENERIQKENEAEKEALRKEKRDIRIESLINLGFSLNSANVYSYTAGKHYYTIPEGDIADFLPDEWKEIVSLAKNNKNLLDSNFKLYQESEKEEQEKKHRIELREQEIKNLFSISDKNLNSYCRKGEYQCTPEMHVLFEDISDLDVNDWSELIEVLKLEYKGILEANQVEKLRLEKEDEAKRISALGDSELVYEWLKEIAEIVKNFPTIKDETIIASYNVFDSKLGSAMDELTDALDALK